MYSSIIRYTLFLILFMVVLLKADTLHNTIEHIKYIQEIKHPLKTKKYNVFKKNKHSLDDTALLVEFLKNNQYIFFPKGDYYFQINRIELKSNTIFIGEGAKTKFFVSDSTKFKSANPDALFKVSGKQNIQIKNISFYGKNNTAVVVGIYSSRKLGQSKNITIANNYTNKMGLIWVSPKNGFTFNRIDEKGLPWGQIGPISPYDISTDINVYSNQINGDTSKSLTFFRNKQASGISLLFVNNAQIIDNNISHMYFGIWSYGGGSLSSDKKKLTSNPIWCKDILMAGNIVSTTFSPIWVSRCKNIQIYTNIMQENLDVALDFEGSYNSIANHNIVINSQGGALTPLNGSANIIFENNIVVSNHESIYGINITLLRNGNKNIIYKNNFFQATGFSHGKIQITRTNKKIEQNKNIVFRDNVFENIYQNNKDGSDIQIDTTNKGLQTTK